MSGVPVNADRVVITGFDANGFPLYTIDQAIDVIGGETTVVPAVSNAVAVQLMELRLVSGDFSDLTTGLTTVSVASGGTFQVFLIAEYDNGTLAIVGDNATYAIAASGSAIASVNNLGTISGLSVGNTTFTAEFGGQTLTLPVAVTDGLPINFSSLIVENTQPIEIATGTPVTLTIVADNMFGLSPSDSRLSYSIDNAGFTVANGVVSLGSATNGATGTVTVTYTNPDTTTLTATATVVASVTAP